MMQKSLVLASALSLAMASLAGAATTNYVYMTGSTAARAQVYATYNDVGVVFQAAPTVITQGSTSANGASYMSFYGQLVGDSSGNITCVKAHWSGSEAGIADLVSGTEAFLADGAANSLASATPGPFVNSPVDLAMADNNKTYSKNPTAAITGAFVGVIPFVFVKEKGSLAGITNVTDAQIRVILTGGSPAALVTGNAADTSWVYLSGRDSLSGTRVNAQGDTAFGIKSSPQMVAVNADGSMLQVPAGSGTVLGDTGFGFGSGGTLAGQMGFDLSQATAVDLNVGSGHYSVISYLGISDSQTAVAAGGTVLTFNGVAESPSNVQQGLYTFWGNEFVYRKNTVSSQAQSVYTLLASVTNGINAHADNVKLIDSRTMQATRNGPTSDVTHN